MHSYGNESHKLVHLHSLDRTIHCLHRSMSTLSKWALFNHSVWFQICRQSVADGTHKEGIWTYNLMNLVHIFEKGLCDKIWQHGGGLSAPMDNYCHPQRMNSWFPNQRIEL